MIFVFQTNLQHNYPEKNDERQYATSPEMWMTSVIRLKLENPPV